jgi:hypothetical protein
MASGASEQAARPHMSWNCIFLRPGNGKFMEAHTSSPNPNQFSCT